MDEMQKIIKFKTNFKPLTKKELDKLISECKKKKRASQSELYKTFASKMYGLCISYAKDYTEAQDILQDGFLKVFEKIDQFSNKGSFEGWMRKIFVNTALERYRKKKLLFTVDDDETNILNTLMHDEIESKINANELIEVIKTISPQYKLVFMLYCIEGYTHKEISEKLNISIGTSKSNLARARKILQEKVTEKYRIDPIEVAKVL